MLTLLIDEHCSILLYKHMRPFERDCYCVSTVLQKGGKLYLRCSICRRRKNCRPKKEWWPQRTFSALVQWYSSEGARSDKKL